MGTLYLKTSVHDNPTWHKVEVFDLVNPPSAEISSRIQVEITAATKFDVDDMAFVILDDAFTTKATLDILYLNGPIGREGSCGLRLDMKLSRWAHISAGGITAHGFNLKPSNSENETQRAVVAGGVLGMTPLRPG